MEDEAKVREALFLPVGIGVKLGVDPMAAVVSGSESVDELGVEPGVIGRVGELEKAEEEVVFVSLRELKDARVPVTHSNDPPENGSGGHLSLGMSKMPLEARNSQMWDT